MGPETTVATATDLLERPAVDPVDTRKTILWVTPVFQSVYPKPFQNFLGMAIAGTNAECQKYRIHVWVPERQLLHSAMNQAFDLAMKHDYDAVVLSDDDCGPPMDAISRLLRRYEAGHDVVAGVGFMRGYPHTTTIGRYFPEGTTLQTDPVTRETRMTGFYWIEDLDREQDRDGLIRADFCGFPIAIFSKRAIQAIAEKAAPWFGTEIDGGSCTHDVYFGVKAKRAGIQILVDRQVSCSHLLDGAWLTESNRTISRQLGTAWKQANVEAIKQEQPV